LHASSLSAGSIG